MNENLPNDKPILKGRCSIGYIPVEPYCLMKCNFRVFPDGGPELVFALKKEEIRALLDKDYPQVEPTFQQIVELHSLLDSYIKYVQNRPFRPVQKRDD